MAKGSRGGKRTSGTTVAMGGSGATSATPITQSAPQIDDTQQAKAMSASYDAFMAMSDDQKADAIEQMVQGDVPVFLADNDFQKLTFTMGLNDKPQLVDDGVLDTMNGTELFRNINAVNDDKNRIRYSADMIASQVQKGSVTRVSDSGGSNYGRGIYFASNYADSAMYGDYRVDIKKTSVIRCKLNSNAKVVNYTQAITGVSKEIASGSKLGKALEKCDYYSQSSIWALAKGYNVITNGRSYYNILNRNAVTMSKDIKAQSSKW